MADTTNYGWTKPTVNADVDAWGGIANIAFDDIDADLKTVSDDSKNASNLTSGTVPAARGGAGTANGILKADGSGNVSAATASVDYCPASQGTSLLSGNGSGGLANVTLGSGLTFSSGTLSANVSSGSSLLSGNGSGGFSNVTVGTGLSFSGGTLATDLNLGTMATKNITVSTSDPSGTPADGDLWIKVAS